MINIKDLTITGWEDVKDSALVTVHKNYTGEEITSAWKHKILKAEHSPIRELIIRATFENVPRWIADQLARHHIGFQPYMGTMRPDRGNHKPRNEQSLTDETVIKLTMNAQALINVCHERLCNVVSKETRELWERFIEMIRVLEPELAFYCVPSCINRAYCKELKTCGFLNKFVYKMVQVPDMDIFDCADRYMYYHNEKDSKNV
jgi:thymidylate synthase ThyX